MTASIKLFIFVVIFMPCFVAAEVYKCTDTNGKTKFSDRPCKTDTVEEKISLKTKEADWVSLLRSQKPHSVRIVDVVRDDRATTIQINFRSNSDSSKFLQLANDLSGMAVSLKKIRKSREAGLSWAEVEVSATEKSNKSNKPRSPFSMPSKPPRKPNRDYKHSKCIDKLARQQKMTFQEACNYSVACPKNGPDEHIVMYCLHDDIGRCYGNKTWITISELTGIADNIPVGNVSREITYKNGKKTGKICVFYD